MVPMTNEERLTDLLAEYRSVAKPLMEELFMRMGEYPVNCQNEIRAFNDHIARCYREGASQPDICKELDKASGHIQRLVYDCLKQLNVLMYEDIERIESSTYSYKWLFIDKGRFWKQYVTHKQAAVICEVEAKKQESLNPSLSVDKYQEAYLHYVEIDKMFNVFAVELKDSRWHKVLSTWMKGWQWLWVTVLVAVITAVLRFVVSYYLSCS